MDDNAVAKALTEARALVACLEDMQQRGQESVEASKHLVLLEHVDKLSLIHISEPTRR